MTFTRDPKFGRDAWIGPGRPGSSPDSVEALIAGAARPIYRGADTLAGDIGLLPAGLPLYASYIDNYGGFGELVARFGHTSAVLIPITIFGAPAVCADLEPGAMQIGQFPGWYDTAADHSLGLPWGYTSASNMQALIAAAAGRPFIRWSAHYGFGEHVCGPRTCGYPQADWTQWAMTGPQGQNFDRSIGYALPGPAPKPPPPEDIMAIAAVQTAQGDTQVIVEAKDGSLWYTFQQKGQNAWNGGVGGKHIAGLVPFAPAPQ